MNEAASGMIVLRLCGLNVCFVAPKSILDVVRSRFHHLAAGDAEAIDLRFQYILDRKLGGIEGASMSGVGRLFYESEFGRATYFPEDDCCRFSLDSGAHAFCFPGTGSCKVFLQNPMDEKWWVAAHPLITMPLLEMLKRRNLFFVHAAAFALDGRCLMLPGPSGAGKSTLSVAMLLGGMSYMGDDLCLLEGVGAERVMALPERISLTSASLEMFKDSLPSWPEGASSGFPKHEVESTTWSNLDVCWDALPAAIVFPEVAHTPYSVLSPMSRDEALSRLSSNLLLTDLISTQRHLNSLGALVKNVDAYSLQTGADLKQTAELMRSLLR